MTLQHVRALNLVAMLAAVGVVACGDDDSSGPTVVKETYVATLNSAQERQANPVVSNGTGTATIVLFGAGAGDSISYDVKIGQIDSVIFSHIHAGDPTVSGGIMFGWPNTVPPTSFGALTQFQLGMIQRTSTFTGIFTFDSLVTRLRGGAAYVNVHTRKYGGGEIRGNLTKQ
jgi:CHRD domain-containing protein